MSLQIAPELTPIQEESPVKNIEQNIISSGSKQLLNPQMLPPHDPEEGPSGKRKYQTVESSSDDESTYDHIKDATSGSGKGIGDPDVMIYNLVSKSVILLNLQSHFWVIQFQKVE